MADWWNVDLLEFPGIDEVFDATAAWPWSGLDYVYGEHFLEHLPLDGAFRFACESAVALRPGGVIRLSTPSLEHVWATNFRPDRERGREAAVGETYRVNRSFHGWGHRFLFSRVMLETMLEAAGFADLTFHEQGESGVEALRGLERHPGWEVVDGWPSVWIVEGRATGAPHSRASEAMAAEIEAEFARYARTNH
jgi:predicted SAM-dependent methyltransferase